MVESWTVSGIVAAVVVGFAKGVMTLWPVVRGSLPWSGMRTLEVIAGESREEIRERSAVRELRPLEEGAKLFELPNGVYGYSTPWEFCVDSVLERSRIDQVALTKTSYGTSVVEVHKASEGKVFVLLYVTESDLTRLESPMHKGVLRVTAFFDSHKEYSWLVRIPVSRLVGWNDRHGTVLSDFVEFQIR